MLFIAILTHPPELCFANDESWMVELRDFIKNMKTNAEKAGIKLHGAYINSNEHTFYFIIETEDYRNVDKFLGPPMLTHHTAKITPVLKLEWH